MVFKKEILDSHSDFTRSLSHQSASPEAYDQENVFSQDFQPFMKQDKETQNSASQPTSEQSLANRDPCTVPDDLREEMMRQRRKEDAFKTALCDAYKRSQACSYGDQCRFAHGVHELRLPMNPRGRNHPKYKTVLCDKFSMTGNCKYGTRCQFIHKIVDGNAAKLASGAHANTSSKSPARNAAAHNHSLFVPQGSTDRSMDLNQSLPIRQSDLVRAFARATRLDVSGYNSTAQLAQYFESQFQRIQQLSSHHH